MEITNSEKYIIIRKRKKISLKVLAEHLQCSINLISLFENGKSGMSIDKVSKYESYIDNHE